MVRLFLEELLCIQPGLKYYVIADLPIFWIVIIIIGKRHTVIGIQIEDSWFSVGNIVFAVPDHTATVAIRIVIIIPVSMLGLQGLFQLL